MSISVIGLGKLGTPILAAIASKGCDVFGVDSDRRTVELLLKGVPPIHEPGLHDLLHDNATRIRVSTQLSEALFHSDVSLIIVPTPSEPSGGFSLVYVESVLDDVAQILCEKRRHHTLVLVSTILPGSFRKTLLPLLKHRLGEQLGPRVGVCYSPQFVALGSVIRDFLHPDFVLIGELDCESGDALSNCYEPIFPAGTPLVRTNLENAELAKLAVNTFVTTKITFANMLSDLCERLPGTDVDVVAGVLGLDHRIGLSCLKGGTAYGGPCFPRDNLALCHLARTLNTRAELAEVTDKINRALPSEFVAKFRHLFRHEIKVGVLGLAYKAFSDVVVESASMKIIKELLAIGLRVYAYDSSTKYDTLGELQSQLILCGSASECVSSVNVILVLTADPRFVELPTHIFMDKTIIDCWRLFGDRFENVPSVNHVKAGYSTSQQRSDVPITFQ
jgi:UDPglucose 6-dehydrogenase